MLPPQTAAVAGGFWPNLNVSPGFMKTYQPADIRNFAIVGHASSGKTMLSEAMLMCGGVINRMGRIADGSTVSDYHVSEKNRQISVSASLLHTEWMGKKFNIIDTPGYLDFISEGLGALRVGDFALVVVHAQHGLGVGTERVWNYATELRHSQNDRRQRAGQGERGFRRRGAGSCRSGSGGTCFR